MSFLNKALLRTCLLAGALCTSPLAEHQGAALPAGVTSAGSASTKACGGDFPAPEQGLVLTPENCSSLVDLLNQFSAVTGEALLYSPDTKSLLEERSTGLQQGLVVAPEDVYATVQDILISNRIALTDLRRENPRMLWVDRLDQRNPSRLRAQARFVPSSELGTYSTHSAILITTVLHLPHMDTRATVNSLRSMVSDPNTTQIVAVRDPNAIILTGFGNSVNHMANLLRDLEKTAAAESARQAALRQAAGQAQAATQGQGATQGGGQTTK